MGDKEGENMGRIREVLTDEDIKRIEESYKEDHRIAPCHEPSIVIEVDNEFGNMLIKTENKAPRKSSEGMAFVTIAIDENGEIAYIAIEPEDYDLAKFVRRINVTGRS
jgi:hypothetical protein